MTEIELTRLMGPVPEFSSEKLVGESQRFPTGLILMTGIIIGGVLLLYFQHGINARANEANEYKV